MSVRGEDKAAVKRRPSVPRGVAGRASWNLIDQALSAVSNVGLTVVIAKSTDARGFGSFSVAFLIFSLHIGLVRAVIGQPLQVRVSKVRGDRGNCAYREALGASMLFGAAGGALCVFSAAVAQGSLGRVLLVVGVCLPVLLLQDTCRFVFFSTSRAKKAASNDALWAGLEFGALGIMVLARITDEAVLALAWGASAAVAAGYGLYQLQFTPAFPRALWWVWQQRDLGRYFVAEFLLGQGSAQVSVLLFGLLGSTTGLGSLRAAQVLLGPLAICGAAAFTFTIPEVARQPQLSARQRQRISWAVAAVMGLITLIYGGVLLLLPAGIGIWLLGGTWHGAREVLLAVSVGSLANSIATGPAAVMYGMGRAQTTFRLHLLATPLLPAGIALGFYVAQTTGTAWGIAIAQAVVLPAWFQRLRAIAGKPIATDARGPST
jgi:O-antigen/teichoic acid export membrane protein